MNLFDNIVNRPILPQYAQEKFRATSSQMQPQPMQQAQPSLFDKYMQDSSISANGKKAMQEDLQNGVITQEQANKIISDIYAKRQTQPKQTPQREGSFIGNVVGGIVSEVPKVIGETASFFSKAGQYMPGSLIGTAIQAGFSDKTFGQLREEQKAQAEQLAGFGQAGKEFVQTYGAYNPESVGAKIGETGTDIASTFIGPNKGRLVKEGAGIVGKYGAKALNLAQEGAVMGAKYDIATKGEITPEGAGIGAGANILFGGGIGLAKRAYEGATKRLPASLTLGGLINPQKLDVVKKGLQVDEGVATPEDVGKWILDRVKPGNKQEIAEQLIQHAEKTKGAVDESLASIPTYFKNKEAKKALMQIRADLEGKVGLEGRISQIDELLAKPDYTLSELNGIKRELDNMYNMYTKTADPTAGLKAEGLRNVRANLRGFIEKEAEKYGVNIRKLNNETSVARGLAEGILRKDSSEAVRELLTAFAPSGAGAAVGAGQAIARGEDPLTVLRDALIGGIATKFATSTTVRTNIANALNKLVPKDLTALENYIRSGGKDAIGKKVAEKVIKEGRALPARTITKPSDFAKTPEKAIITPQTQQRAIIQESKKGLSPNVKRPNGNTNNTPSNSSNIPVGAKKVQKPSSEVTSSATQARGPIDPTTGKRKTIVQSPTAYEAGIRRPYTLNGNKPIVKRASDIDSTDPLYEFKTMKGVFADEFKGKSEVMEAINDIGGVDNIKRHTVKIDILRATENYNVGNEGVQRAIKEIESGKKIPLIVDEAGDIMDGNHRYSAYKALGIDDVPIVSPKSFTPKPKTIEKKSYIVKSNKKEHIPKELFIIERSSKPNGKGQKYYKIEDETGWVYTSSPRTKSYAIEELKRYQEKYGLSSKVILRKIEGPSISKGDEVLMSEARKSTMGDMETKKIKKPKALRVYDVIKSKNNDITAVPFDDFYSLARVSTKGMTKDKAWGLWMNKILQKVKKGESIDIEILKKYPLAGAIIKDFLKTRINPFE